MFRQLGNAGRLYGIDLPRFMRSLAAVPGFIGQARRYAKGANDGPFPFSWKKIKPFLADAGDQASLISMYGLQDLWAAKRVLAAKPTRHVDIGSRIDGFITHLLLFMPVEVIDIRPLDTPIEGLSFTQADATNLENIADGTIESISTLHTVEHFGLGRYSDPIDPQACFLAMKAIQRVLAPGGRLYFSVPVGRQRVEFNAHRVYWPKTIVEAFDELKLVEFSCIDDDQKVIENADMVEAEKARYACGLFIFEKPAATD